MTHLGKKNVCTLLWISCNFIISMAQYLHVVPNNKLGSDDQVVRRRNLFSRFPLKVSLAKFSLEIGIFLCVFPIVGFETSGCGLCLESHALYSTVTRVQFIEAIDLSL
jgi:hypothetical protein